MTDKKRKILVQDDTAMFRLPGTVLVRSFGFDVVEATHGLEGLEVLSKDNDFVAVFTDVEMPNMNGFEFLAAVRKNPALSKVMIVMCTTLNQPEHIARAKSLGANGYIVKPMTKEGLEAALRHLKLIN